MTTNVTLSLDGAEFVSVSGDPGSTLEYQIQASNGTNIGSYHIMNTQSWSPAPGGKFPSKTLTFQAQ